MGRIFTAIYPRVPWELGDPGLVELELLLNRPQLQTTPFDATTCAGPFMAGVITAKDAPLLFKGEDFPFTDVMVAC